MKRALVIICHQNAKQPSIIFQHLFIFETILNILGIYLIFSWFYLWWYIFFWWIGIVSILNIDFQILSSFCKYSHCDCLHELFISHTHTHNYKYPSWEKSFKIYFLSGNLDVLMMFSYLKLKKFFWIKIFSNL